MPFCIFFVSSIHHHPHLFFIHHVFKKNCESFCYLWTVFFFSSLFRFSSLSFGNTIKDALKCLSPAHLFRTLAFFSWKINTRKSPKIPQLKIRSEKMSSNSANVDFVLCPTQCRNELIIQMLCELNLSLCFVSWRFYPRNYSECSVQVGQGGCLADGGRATKGESDFSFVAICNWKTKRISWKAKN